MGQGFSMVRRSIQNFDLEHRAFKYIDNLSKKPIAAPKHPHSLPIERLNDKSLADLSLPKPDLNKRVDQFEIKSTSIKDGILPPGVEYVEKSNRKLPQKICDPSLFPDPPMEFGFVVPEKVPIGKLTMRQSVELIKSYQTNQSTPEQLAEMYSLDVRQVNAIVEHFVLFALPSKLYWMPPMLMGELTNDQKLLDKPVEEKALEEPLGGAVHHDRREALLGLDNT